MSRLHQDLTSSAGAPEQPPLPPTFAWNDPGQGRTGLRPNPRLCAVPVRTPAPLSKVKQLRSTTLLRGRRPYHLMQQKRAHLLQQPTHWSRCRTATSHRMLLLAKLCRPLPTQRPVRTAHVQASLRLGHLSELCARAKQVFPQSQGWTRRCHVQPDLA